MDDYALALQLQEQFDCELSELSGYNDRSLFKDSDSSVKTIEFAESMKQSSLVDEKWELLDPNPDIRAMFLEFNDEFFWGKLAGVEVRWSPRMTS